MRYTKQMGPVILDFDNEWGQLFGKYNWYTFHFVNLEIEWDKYCGSLEFMINFLGFGVRIAYAIPNKLSEENNKRWSKEVDKWMKKSKKK